MTSKMPAGASHLRPPTWAGARLSGDSGYLARPRELVRFYRRSCTRPADFVRRRGLMTVESGSSDISRCLDGSLPRRRMACRCRPNQSRADGGPVGRRIRIHRNQKFAGGYCLCAWQKCRRTENLPVLEDTVSSELIRRKDGSIVSISKFGEVIPTVHPLCCETCSYTTTVLNERIWYFGGQNILWPSYIFSGGQDP